MAFWTDRTLEPKRAYRFLIQITGMDGGATFIAKKVNKPEIDISETEHKYLNHTFYYPGRVTWNTVTATLVDPVDPDASQTLASMIEAAGYIIPRNANEVTTMSKASSVNSLGSVIIQQYNDAHPERPAGPGEGPSDSLGNTLGLIEEWTLNNAWIKRVKFGELDYESDELNEIEIEFRYDWADFKTLNDTSALVVPGPLDSLGKSLNERFKNNQG